MAEKNTFFICISKKRCNFAGRKLFNSLKNNYLNMKPRLYTLLMSTIFLTMTSQAQVTPVSQMEKLDRGVVVVPSSTTKNFISWRLLGTDDKSTTTFDVLRNGQTVATNLTKTNYEDPAQSEAKTAEYQIVTKVNGEVTETSEKVSPWERKVLILKLDRPEGGVHASWDGSSNVAYDYTPNDMSVGDVDGDGAYELFVKWDPSHSQDNSYSKGYTGSVYIDCYKLDGTKLWRIDLGDNIRAGAHYTQFMVYDFDGDGKAEMMCKTATGSKDGLGNYVNQAATDATIKGHANNKDYRNSSGHILSGPEYLTIFDGETGRAIHTTWYLPGRAGTGPNLPSGKAVSAGEGGSELGKVSTFPTDFWGDKTGNRSERFLGAVAYVNGPDQPACGIFCRGYYTKAYVWAVSFDGSRLHTEWLHASSSGTQWQVYNTHFDEALAYPRYTVDGDVLMRQPVKAAATNTGGVNTSDSNGGLVGSNTLYGNGNHNLSIADVDGDGCDEILWGSAALNNDGTLLYATGYGHGDAIHVGKMIPDSTDYYVFDVHEEKLNASHGSWDLHNARTGYVIWHGNLADMDNGRGVAADLTGENGYEFWSSDNRQPRSAASGKEVIQKSCAVNFRIYWDESYADQLFDGNAPSGSTQANPYIQKWSGSSFSNVLSFNSANYNYGQTCNTTKATPCLQADILGDWREELILWNKNDPSEINIYSTFTPTSYAVPTLMHDHVYRMGVAWQNTAYNQPPHLGYYLPDYISGKLQTGVMPVSLSSPQEEQIYDLQGRLLPYSSSKDLPKGLYLIRTGNKTTKLNK